MRDEKSASAPPLTGLNPPRRILVVEDDDVLRRLNTEVLTDFGYKVDAAQDGASAWAALQLFDYDLLIMDCHIPNLSGIDLLKKLHGARMAMAVIMVSGRMPIEELKHQPWLQIDAALIKPHSHAELLAIVRNVLPPPVCAHALIAPPNEQSRPAADRSWL